MGPYVLYVFYIVYFTYCLSYILCFTYCISYILYILHAVYFTYCIFYMLYILHIVYFTCRIFYILYILHIACFTCLLGNHPLILFPPLPPLYPHLPRPNSSRTHCCSSRTCFIIFGTPLQKPRILPFAVAIGQKMLLLSLRSATHISRTHRCSSRTRLN